MMIYVIVYHSASTHTFVVNKVMSIAQRLKLRIPHGGRRAEPGQDSLASQEDELIAATWMSLEEYSAIPYQLERTLEKQIMDSCMAYAKGDYEGMDGKMLDSELDSSPINKTYLLMFQRPWTWHFFVPEGSCRRQQIECLTRRAVPSGLML